MSTLSELVSRSQKQFRYIQNNIDVTQDFFNSYFLVLTLLNTYKQKIIFLFLDGSYESAAILLACLSRNIQTHAYSQELSMEEIRSELEIFRPHLLVCPRTKSHDLADAGLFNKPIFSMSFFNFHQPQNFVMIDSKKGVNEKKLVTRTSGSTGYPKYLNITESLITQRYKKFVEIYDLKNTRQLLVSSSFHQTITMRALFSSIYLKGTFRSIVPFNWIEWTNDFNNSESFALLVPPQLRKILNQDNLVKDSKGKILLSSSTSNAKEKLLILEKLCDEFYECYGTAEVAIITSKRHRVLEIDNIESLGSPIPGAEILVREGDGKITVKSSEAVSEIWMSDGKKLKRIKIGDWYDTGDYGRILNGELFFLGRGIEIINVGGSKVFASEIERVLLNHPDIDQCLAFPIPNEKLEQVVGLAVVTKNKFLHKSQIQQFASINLEKFKIPQIVLFLQELPITAGGKPDRLSLVKMVEQPSV